MMLKADSGTDTAFKSVLPPARPGWLLLAALGLVASGSVVVAMWIGFSGPRQAGALDGKFSVLVRPPNRSAEPIPVEDPGALPARDGGAIYLEVQLNQPAFAYLIWLDCNGQATPLYPWNNESLEVKDFAQSPPVRRASNRIFSPMLGKSWDLGDCHGMETVLLLARRTPLPVGTSFGALLGSPPSPPPVRLPEELVVLTLAGGGKTVSTLTAKNRGEEKEAQAADEPLKQLMLKLAKDFELVRAVRFAHAGPDGAATN